MLFIKKILFNIIIAFVYAVLSRLIINYSVSNYFESDDIFILKILSYIPIMIFTIFQMMSLLLLVLLSKQQKYILNI